MTFAGDDVWVGAPTTRGYELGSIFVYEAAADGSLPTEPRRIQLPQEETVESDRFGGLVVADADLVAVGAPGMHHQAGSVHVYERGDAGWGGGEMLVSAPDMLGALVGEERRCIEGKVGPFDCDEVELLAYVPPSLLRAEGRTRGVRANDNWGWTDPVTSREYALVGRNDGTSFVDITDPTNPMLVGDLPKPWGTPPSQLWRDIKTYKDHAFVVADGAGEHGMQVFDLTRLRDISVDEMPALFEPDFHYTRIGSSHNIAINEETGIAYTIGGGGAGDTCGGGLHMINIDDPKNPEFVGCAPTGGTHDTQCVIYRGPDEDYQGRELCFNSNGRNFQIQDVTDKDNPVVVANPSSPNPAYIHQGWLTEDHSYFYQDDESDVIAGNVETTRTLIWDVSDLEDPVLVREFMGSMPASAHNLYIRDDLMFQANYLYGLHILDVSDPENPREVGYFDTAPYKGRAGVRRRLEQLPVLPERHGDRDQHAGGAVHPEEEGAAGELRGCHHGGSKRASRMRSFVRQPPSAMSSRILQAVIGDLLYPATILNGAGDSVGTIGTPSPSFRRVPEIEPGAYATTSPGGPGVSDVLGTFDLVPRIDVVAGDHLVFTVGHLDEAKPFFPFRVLHTRLEVYDRHTGTKLYEDIPLPGGVKVIGGGRYLYVLQNPDIPPWRIAKYRLRVGD